MNEDRMRTVSRWARWAASTPRAILSVSPLGLAAGVLRPSQLSRLASETNRLFAEARGEVLPERSPAELLDRSGAVTVVLDETRRSIGTPELIGLLTLVRRSEAKRVFEIGTSSGGTTWHLAANLDAGGEVVTLDLPPETPHQGAYSPRAVATERPSEQRLGSLFRGTPEEQKIRQILCDSADYDPSAERQSFDLVFIDAAHTEAAVRRDTALARVLVRPGGVLCWHDYFVFHPDYGVRTFLHELALTLPVFRLRGTLAAAAVVP
jgi:predicted O-methyltransferase YrrM